MPEWSNGTDSKSVESAMAPRVQIPISPPLHMSKAPGMPGVPGLCLSGERSGIPLPGGRKAVPWFRVPARSCSFPRNAAGPSLVLPFLLLWVVVPLCLFRGCAERAFLHRFRFSVLRAPGRATCRFRWSVRFFLVSRRLKAPRMCGRAAWHGFPPADSQDIGLCRVPETGLGRKKCVRSFPSFAPVSISRSIWTRRSPASTRRAIPISS